MEIYINNKKIEAFENETIIQVADRNDIHIPRFCYHKRLSVVASCRMCLVEVEDTMYPQPACSTIVTDGMKIKTKSEVAEEAQKSTMEFLLINHPLDCPVCDQAGECELQDVSLEHGDYKSEYKEIKRTVVDKDIGDLVSTEMTRCIHCSRCVRFGEEIAGIKELGMTGRGEDTKIETYLNQSLSSELSGNVIDLCPVGALNNSLYKYTARTWDLTQIESISPHDCLGSNIYYHTYKNSIKRCIPKENDNINLSWLSDRDRYGYEGLQSDDRIIHPLIKLDDKLVKSTNTKIVELFSEKINQIISSNKNNKATAVMSAQSSCEEMYLFQKILRSLNINNIDHRTKENNDDYQSSYPVMPSLGMTLPEIIEMDNIILVGVNISKEFPILSIYLREAIKQNSTKIFSISAQNNEEVFDIEETKIMSPAEMPNFFKASNTKLFTSINKNSKNLIILGPGVASYNNYSYFLSTLSNYAKAINSHLGILGDQCNSAGAWAMGIVPHRLPGGVNIESSGMSFSKSIKDDSDCMIVYNLEPEFDFFNDNEIITSLKKSKLNVFFSSFMTKSIEKYADIVFPLSLPQESSGTYVNITRQVQVSNRILSPMGDSLEGLDHLININNHLGSITSKDKVRNEVNTILSNIEFPNRNYVFIKNQDNLKNNNESIHKIIVRTPNSNNPLLRRCKSLLSTHDNDNYISFPDALKLDTSNNVTIKEDTNRIKLSITNKNHDEPKNVIFVKINGVYNQKIGARDSIVSLD